MKNSASFPICVLILIAGLLFLNAPETQGQGASASPLRLKVTGAKTVCMGDRVELKATLENKSSRPLSVFPAAVWNYLTERALDRTSVKGTGPFTNSLKVPDMRGTNGEPSASGPTKRRTLEPKRLYTESYAIDTSSDEFYRTPGRYSITIRVSAGAGDALALSGDHKKEISSNDLAFRLVRCTKIQ